MIFSDLEFLFSLMDDRNSDDERTKGCGVDSDGGGGAWARAAVIGTCFCLINTS